MTFKDVLAQVIDWLQQDKRITYRALKRQFDVDDEYLEDLKAELTQAKQLAVDEEGVVLVWAGASAISEPTAPPAQPTPQPAVQTQQSPQAPDAERRQLTVMFCDLVDSTKLSSQLDPEDWRDVVRAYQKACTEIIQRFDGYVAQLLGDGLLVYFGYPQAHEDDPHRAVRTGLGILAAMGDLNQGLQQTKGIQLAIRIGVHTGLVVVGEMGGAGRQEQLALGEVPNVCSRIEALAEPNTVAISAATYRLVQGYFECQNLGAQALRGVTESMRVYHVLRESGATSRLDVAQPRGLTPLVGREQEVGLLLERWEQVKAGHGHVVLLTGDAGIGKSRLVQVLKERVTREHHGQLECRSLPYYQNTVLYPIVDLFQRLLPWQPNDAPEEKLAILAQELSQYKLPVEESVQLFAPLLSLPLPEDRYPPLHLSPQRQRQKTLETIVAILLELAEHQPVLFIVEDLHWTDPTTLELLNLVLDQTPTASMLVLLTCRPTFQPSWTYRSYLTEVSVTRLAQPQVECMVERVAGEKTLPAEVLQQIVAKTDGVPLFVEELTKAILESGSLKEVAEHYELTGSLATVAIPATLQDSLMSRLDRLMTGKVIAQLGATLGRQFSYALLQAVAQLNERTLQEELHRLVEAELLYQRGVPPQSTYVFKHALIQDAAYESLLRSTRQHYHQQIAQVLKERFPETAETQPELLAHHYTEAGLNAQAVDYWQQAGERARERSAHAETIGHLAKGIDLLLTLPETAERHRLELAMQTTLGLAFLGAKGQGASEVERTLTRARALCHYVEDPALLFRVLLGLRRYYFSRAEPRTSHELDEQLLHLAQQTHDPALLLEAHRVQGSTLYCLGALTASLAHLEQGYMLYDRKQHRTHTLVHGIDPGTMCLTWMSLALWTLGYPDQARQRSRAALTLSQDLSHAYSVASAHYFAARFHQLCREAPAVRAQAEAAIALSTEQRFPLWLNLGTVLLGWALAVEGYSNLNVAPKLW